MNASVTQYMHERVAYGGFACRRCDVYRDVYGHALAALDDEARACRCADMIAFTKAALEEDAGLPFGPEGDLGEFFAALRAQERANRTCPVSGQRCEYAQQCRELDKRGQGHCILKGTGYVAVAMSALPEA